MNRWDGCGVRLGTMVGCALLIVLLLVVGVFFANFARSRQGEGVRRFRDAGVIRIGYAVEPPYAMHGAAGEVTGESPEIARLVVERLGIPRIEWRMVQFGGLTDALKMGIIDVVAAGMFITPDRRKNVLFSIPTTEVLPAMLVPTGNPEGLRGNQDIVRRRDIRAAVLSGSVEELGLEELGLDRRRMVRVPDALTGVKAVEAGLAHVFLLSEPSLRWALINHGFKNFEVAPLYPDSEDRDIAGLPAFAFRLEDAELRDAWNGALRVFLGSKEHCALASRFGLKCSTHPLDGSGS